jgi:hypothetical protein
MRPKAAPAPAGEHHHAYRLLVLAIASAHRAFAEGKVVDAFYSVDDAARWARAVGNPWSGELSDIVEELGSAVRVFRDAAEKFDALFPEDEPSGDPDD